MTFLECRVELGYSFGRENWRHQYLIFLLFIRSLYIAFGRSVAESSCLFFELSFAECCFKYVIVGPPLDYRLKLKLLKSCKGSFVFTFVCLYVCVYICPSATKHTLFSFYPHITLCLYGITDKGKSAIMSPYLFAGIVSRSSSVALRP